MNPLASSFAETDYAAIAQSMGVDGVRVEKASDIRPAMEAALASGRPTVVDVVTAFEGLSFRDVTSPLTQG